MPAISPPSCLDLALRWRRIFPPRNDAAGEPVESTDDDLAMLTANSERLAELRKRLAAADGAGDFEPFVNSGPIAGAAAGFEAPRRLRVRASDQGFLPIQVEHYVMLLDWTGRELRADKRAAIPEHLAPIVERLGLNPSNWVETVRGFGRLFKQAAG